LWYGNWEAWEETKKKALEDAAKEEKEGPFRTEEEREGGQDKPSAGGSGKLKAKVKPKKRKVEEIEPAETPPYESKSVGWLERYDPKRRQAKHLEKLAEKELERKRKQVLADHQREKYFRELWSRWIADVVCNLFEGNEGGKFRSREELGTLINEECGTEFMGRLAKSFEKHAEEEIEMKRKQILDDQREWYFRSFGCRWMADVVNEFACEQVQRDKEGEQFYPAEELADYIEDDYGAEFLDILNSYYERKSKGGWES
jgi:hypothetical protein